MTSALANDVNGVPTPVMPWGGGQRQTLTMVTDTDVLSAVITANCRIVTLFFPEFASTDQVQFSVEASPSVDDGSDPILVSSIVDVSIPEFLSKAGTARFALRGNASANGKLVHVIPRI